jgi:hypothetical protein
MGGCRKMPPSQMDRTCEALDGKSGKACGSAISRLLRRSNWRESSHHYYVRTTRLTSSL